MVEESPTPAGVLLIDKPEGWTSHDVIAKLRRILGVKRIGHAGTLDPMATGLLIVLVGREYTKRQSEFLKQDKVYECEFRLGVTTDTYDRTGQVQQQAEWAAINQVSDDTIRETLASWVGTHQQRVPAFSAVKQKGQKLYTLARAHQLKVADLPSRSITISALTDIHINRNEELQQLLVSCQVACSSGTYIRSLVSDVGDQLKVGAVLTHLRRTHSGQLGVTEALPLPMVTADTVLSKM